MMAISFVVLLFSFVLVSGQDIGPFINPPELPESSGAEPHDLDPSINPVYEVGNPMNITWTTSFSPISLTIWQNVRNTSLQYLPNSSGMSTSSFNWDPVEVNGDNGGPSFDLTLSNIFRFDLYITGKTSPFGRSIWFNLTDDAVDPHGFVISTSTSASSIALPTSTGNSATTEVSSTSSLTSSPISSPTSYPTFYPTSSPTSSSTSSYISSSISSSTPSTVSSSTGSSLGTSGKIGIGIGVGVGVLFGAALAGAFFWLRSKRNRNSKLDSAYVPNNRTSRLRIEYRSEMDGSPRPGGPAQLPPYRR